MRRRTTIAFLLAVVVAGTLLAAVTWPGATAPAGPRGSPAPADLAGPPALGRLQPDPVPWAGMTWEAVETRGFDLQPGDHVVGVIRVDGGLLAYGQGTLDRPNPDGLVSTLTVWLSADGITWRPVPILAGVRAGSVSESRNVAAGPRGVVIAGNTCCGEEGAAVWWSPDGVGWQRAAFPRLAEAYLTGVAAGPDGFVAIGGVRGRGAIWTSVDGIGWTAVDQDEAGLVRGELAHAVALGDGYLVAGMDDRAGRDSQAAVWASTGLAAWRRLAAADPALNGRDEASITRIVPFAGGLFANGGSGTQEDRVQCEGLLNGGLLTAGPATALTCGWLREMTWRSDDGSRWERIDPWGRDGTYPPEPVPPHGRAPINWDRIVPAGPGLVGVLAELADGQPGQEGDLLGVWTSVDARSWQRIGDGPPAADTPPVGLVGLDRRLFALTENGAAWLGTAAP